MPYGYAAGAVLRRWAVGCGVLLALAGGTLPARAADAERYGTVMEQRHEVPAATLAKFLRLHDKNLREARNNAGMMAETERWAAPALEAPTARNPYTLVVRVRGVALADGPVASRWQTAWGLSDGVARGMLLPELTRQNVKAGQVVELVGVSPPTSFKEDRRVEPIVEFMAQQNLRMDSVTLEVWSGMRPTSWLQGFGAAIPLLIGVVFLALVVWVRRR